MIVVSSLDDFNRADSSTLGPNWSHEREDATAPFISIAGNSAVGDSSFPGSWWNIQRFGPDVEVQLGLEGWLNTGMAVRLYARLLDPNPTYPYRMNIGYSAGFAANTASLAVRTDQVTSTSLGTGLLVMDSSGAAVGLRCEGDTISALARFDGSSSWSTLVTATDSTFPDEGYVGFALTTPGGVAVGVSAGDEEGPAPTVTRAAWGILAR